MPCLYKELTYFPNRLGGLATGGMSEKIERGGEVDHRFQRRAGFTEVHTRRGKFRLLLGRNLEC